MSVKSSVLWLLSLFSNSVHRKPQAFGMGLLGLALSMGLVQSAQADNRLGGISTRSFVQTESANYMIAGVFINGGSKRVVVRASSVDGVLNPRLEVQSYPDGNLLYSNDNWATDPSAAELQQTGWAPNGTSDAAMIITLSPGLYTMQVSPVDKPGVGLIEVYELNSTESPKLGGISTRSFVQTDSMNYMIAGLFISGSAKRVVVRASSVDGVLDPRLEVQSYPDGNLLYSNDNWGTDPSAAELQQTGWAPARSLDAAMIITLSPGLYTMQVSPKSSPGIGLIEVYELPEEPDGPKYSSTPASGGTLSFSTPVSTPVTQYITISEKGDADLEIKQANITGSHASDFSILTAFPFTIVDGGSAKTVTVQCTPFSEGIRTADLQISSNDGSTHTYSMQCTGIKKGEPNVKFSPTNSLDFGKATVNATVKKEIAIMEIGNADLEVGYFNIDGSHASDFEVMLPHSIDIPDGGGIQRMTIACTPSAKGIREATLELYTNAHDNEWPSFALKCEGIVELVAAKYSSVPKPNETLNFGDVKIGTKATRAIACAEVGDAELKVDYFNINGTHSDDFSILPPSSLSIPDDGSPKEMTVQCQPKANGLRTATLTLQTNDPNNAFPSYPLSCTGRVECSPVDFDPQGRSDFIPSLGFGYDKPRDLHKPQSCLNGNNAQIGSGEAKLDFNLVSSYEQLKKELGITVDFNISATIFKLNAHSEFAVKHRETKLSKSMVLKSEIWLHKQFNHQGLNEYGQKMLDNGERCFINACGNSFVYQADIGGRLFVAMKFDFSSEEYKKTFFASLGASYKMVDIKATVKKLDQSTIQGGSITLSAHQIGGDVTKLGNVFSDSSILNCSLTNLSFCEQAMNNAINYAQSEFANSVNTHEQILSFKPMTYSNMGVPLTVEDVPMNIIKAKTELVGLYQQQYSDWMLAEGWLSGGSFANQFTHTEKSYLTQIQTTIQGNLEMIRNAGLWCFSDLSRCLDKKQAALSNLVAYNQTWYPIKIRW
ncbi:MAG: choice-of-anchor D domain-containing protein [Thiomargarita sp.]|nr:choice-of-anchor D domain-containing protein [Thiomargarita sp.]